MSGDLNVFDKRTGDKPVRVLQVRKHAFDPLIGNNPTMCVLCRVRLNLSRQPYGLPGTVRSLLVSRTAECCLSRDPSTLPPQDLDIRRWFPVSTFPQRARYSPQGTTTSCARLHRTAQVSCKYNHVEHSAEPVSSHSVLFQTSLVSHQRPTQVASYCG